LKRPLYSFYGANTPSFSFLRSSLFGWFRLFYFLYLFEGLFKIAKFNAQFELQPTRCPLFISFFSRIPPPPGSPPPNFVRSRKNAGLHELVRALTPSRELINSIFNPFGYPATVLSSLLCFFAFGRLSPQGLRLYFLLLQAPPRHWKFLSWSPLPSLRRLILFCFSPVSHTVV